MPSCSSIRRENDLYPPMPHTARQYKADFLWPHEEGSVEEAGYEVINASTEEYREEWWLILIGRIQEQRVAMDGTVQRVAAAMSDSLTQLGVDPDERPDHGGETTGECLARIAVKAME